MWLLTFNSFANHVNLKVACVDSSGNKGIALLFLEQVRLGLVKLSVLTWTMYMCVRSLLIRDGRHTLALRERTTLSPITATICEIHLRHLCTHVPSCKRSSTFGAEVHPCLRLGHQGQQHFLNPDLVSSTSFC